MSHVIIAWLLFQHFFSSFFFLIHSLNKVANDIDYKYLKSIEACEKLKLCMKWKRVEAEMIFIKKKSDEKSSTFRLIFDPSITIIGTKAKDIYAHTHTHTHCLVQAYIFIHI